MRALLGALTTAVAFGVFAPAAMAIDYCVNYSDPVCQDSSHTTLQDALDAASVAAGDDTIHLAGIAYTDAGDNATETFLYPGGPAGAVTIVGQGSTTRLQRTNVQDKGVFRSASTTQKVTLKNLAIDVVGAFGVSAFFGVEMSGPAELDGVLIEVGLSNTTEQAALLQLEGSSTIKGSTFLAKDNSQTTCVKAEFTSLIEVVNSTFSDCETGLATFQGVALRLDRSRFLSGGTGTTFALELTANASFRVDNTLVAQASGGSGIRVQPLNNSTASGVINQTTIAGGGGGTQLMLDTSLGANAVASVSLFDSILTGPGSGSITQIPFAGQSANNTLTKQFNFYDFDPGSALDSDETFGPTDIDSDPGTPIDPGFVGTGSDPFALGTTTLRDKDPAGLRSGEPTGGDILGNSRISNGSRDLGAYEFQFVPPVVPPVVPTVPPPLTPQFTGTLNFSKSKVKRKKAAKLSYSLTAPSTVTFTLKASKKKNKVPKLQPQAGKAGANSYSISTKKLKAGKYTLTATVNGTSKSARLTVTK